MLNLCAGTAKPLAVAPVTMPDGAGKMNCDIASCVTDTVPVDPCRSVRLVVAAGMKRMFPYTSQSPAERITDATLRGVLLTSPIAEPAATFVNACSPTPPALTLSFVAVPTIPSVEDGVTDPENTLFPAMVSLALARDSNATCQPSDVPLAVVFGQAINTSPAAVTKLALPGQTIVVALYVMVSAAAMRIKIGPR